MRQITTQELADGPQCKQTQQYQGHADDPPNLLPIGARFHESNDLPGHEGGRQIDRGNHEKSQGRNNQVPGPGLGHFKKSDDQPHDNLPQTVARRAHLSFSIEH